MMRRLILFAVAVAFAGGCVSRKTTASPAAPKAQEAMAKMDHSAHSMASHHADMDLHMRMTPLRPLTPGDRQRADEIVAELAPAIERYRDFHAAEQDGYRIFLPDIPQKMYHFTNWAYGMAAAFRFDPTRPTSLLYEKEADGYRLIGAMYTARPKATEAELDRRVPLSIAQWHAHVQICLAPRGLEAEMRGPHPRFGPRGSIVSEAGCSAAGGRWKPQLFGWMVHVYPFEKDRAEVWSLERQMAD
jgi:hypothetical protein